MTYLLVDGENFKRKIGAVFKSLSKKRPVWHKYNFKGLIDKVLKEIKIERVIFYFASQPLKNLGGEKLVLFILLFLLEIQKF